MTLLEKLEMFRLGCVDMERRTLVGSAEHRSATDFADILAETMKRLRELDPPSDGAPYVRHVN